MNGGGLVIRAAAALPAGGQGVAVPWELVLPYAAQYGALGLVCLWLMWRVEKKLDALRESDERLTYALNNMTKAQLLEVTSREEVPERVKRLAETMLEQIRKDQAVADAKTAPISRVTVP